MYNQELLGLLADCVARDVAVTLIFPKASQKIAFFADLFLKRLVANVHQRLRDQAKAALLTIEFTDSFIDRMTQLAESHEETMLITANKELRLKNVNIFRIDTSDEETASVAMELIRELIFSSPDSGDEASSEGRQSPPLRLFEGLAPAPGEPGYRPPEYHQH